MRTKAVVSFTLPRTCKQLMLLAFVYALGYLTASHFTRPKVKHPSPPPPVVVGPAWWLSEATCDSQRLRCRHEDEAGRKKPRYGSYLRWPKVDGSGAPGKQVGVCEFNDTGAGSLSREIEPRRQQWLNSCLCGTSNCTCTGTVDSGEHKGKSCQDGYAWERWENPNGADKWCHSIVGCNCASGVTPSLTNHKKLTQEERHGLVVKNKLLSKVDIDRILVQRTSNNSNSRCVRSCRNHPVIGIGMGSTSRKVSAPKLKSLSLVMFTKMLPSLINFVEHGFEYWVYIAVDNGDALYDKDAARVHDWIQTHVTKPLHSKGIDFCYAIIPFENPAKKPGPAFNVAMAALFEDGADYLYRTNDDTVLSSTFASTFIKKLESYRPQNVGVVAPTHRGGLTSIMTHDFVHRTHMEIFPTYYPSIFGAYFMDDWMTHVYGNDHTCMMDHVNVEHTMGDGERYSVDLSVSCYMEYELMAGDHLIATWVEKNMPGEQGWERSAWFTDA